MATSLFVDLEHTDLSRTIAGREEILALCPQRGRFAMLDGVLHFGAETQLVVAYKRIHSGDWWVPDHIPGRPLFPGALMVESAAQMCTWDFYQRRPQARGSFVGFAGLNDTRFRGTVEPECRMLFLGKVLRMRDRLFSYAVQGVVEGALVFESEIIGALVEAPAA